MSVQAQYASAAQTAVIVTLAAGDALGTVRGPAQFEIGLPSPGNGEHDDLMARVAAGEVVIAAYVPPPPTVPATISDRQFAQVLAIDGVITEDEALSWAARGDLPAAMEAALALLPPASIFGARMLLAAATAYERDHPLVPTLGAILGYGDAALDGLWTRAAAL